MQKISLKVGLTIAFIVVALGASAYAVTYGLRQGLGGAVVPVPSISPEVSLDDWKTFTNSTFNYSLRYPSDLEFIEEYIELEKSDQIALAYKPGTPEYEVRFGLKVVYPGYLDSLPTVKEALASGDLEKFATYLWDSNKGDVRTVSELKKTQVGEYDAYTFSVTDKLTIGKGETHYVLNGWQDFKRDQQVTVLEHENRFFITYYPAAYTEGQEILQTIEFN